MDEAKAIGVRVTRALLAIAVTVVALGGLSPASAAFAGCESSGAQVTVGSVACRVVNAASTLGGNTAFSYYVPAGCTASQRCPTLYLLHGFGGDYTIMLGTAAAPSAWVQAMTRGPTRNPQTAPDPWVDTPATWQDLTPLRMVLVAPHGRTLANHGAFGPAADLDLFWADWNPRFANGEAYESPPPRFETFLLDTLIPHVEATFPVGSGRAWRAIDGVSLGGYGSFKTGLQHPDMFASVGSVSGAHNVLVAPGPDPLHDAPGLDTAPPLPLPYLALPALASRIPIEAFPGPSKGFAAAFYVFGDPTIDQAWYRGNQPRDLAMNARAFAGDDPSLRLRSFVNDAIPRRAADFGPSYPVAQAFEALVLEMNRQMQAALRSQDVPAAATTHAVHPGLHSGPYWDPFLRGQLEAHAALLAPDGTPPPAPTAFDFRSISRDFSIWGWRFVAEREPVEFLNLRDVSCNEITLQGTGVVTVTIPAGCPTTWGGLKTFNVDLGDAYPTDEQAGASAYPVYGNTVTLALQ